MGLLRILHLSDDRPGHYHLAEGVIAAAGRLREVACERRLIRRRRPIPGRFLRAWAGRPSPSAAAILGLGYGVRAGRLPAADLVVSAGGETLAANIAAARHLDAANIFCGSLRGLAPERFSLVVTSYERFAETPRHIVALKPSAIDPAALSRPQTVPRFSAAQPPGRIGLLIGGDSGLFKYRDDEWRTLLAFLPALSARWGTRWLVSTSPRTAPWVADALGELARDTGVVEDFIDFRREGPGTLPRLLGRADAVLCTEDSSTMISEAVSARLPVVGVAPEAHAFKPEEADYRRYMMRNDWCRFLALSELTAETLGQALDEVRPLAENPLDLLAGRLKERLPALFG